MLKSNGQKKPSETVFKIRCSTKALIKFGLLCSLFDIHKAFQLEVCDQYNEKLSKGRLKVPQIGFLYLLLS